MDTEISSEKLAFLRDSANRKRLLDYLSEGVPNHLLAKLFGVSVDVINIDARAMQQQSLRIRASRTARFSAGVLLELHDRLAEQWDRDRWDEALYRIVRDEIWTAIVRPAFPFEKYSELMEILTSDHDTGPYEKLAKTICGGFHSAERDIQHLVRNELSEILDQRKAGNECSASALLKTLKTQMGQRLRLGALNARALTTADRELVDRVLESLPPRERQILKLRFGLSEDPMTLAQIGRLTSLSSSRISQLEYRAMRRLRHPSQRRQLEHLFSVETVLKRLEARVTELTAERDELRRAVQGQNSPQTEGETTAASAVSHIPLDELQLSIRAYNCLRNLEVKTVGDILKCTEVKLLRGKNAGRKTIAEIKTVLASMGLSLSERKDS